MAAGARNQMFTPPGGLSANHNGGGERDVAPTIFSPNKTQVAKRPAKKDILGGNQKTCSCVKVKKMNLWLRMGRFSHIPYPFHKVQVFLLKKLPNWSELLDSHLAVLDPEKTSLNGLFSLLNM